MSFYSTRQVAKLLGIPVGRLTHAIWDGRVNAPVKGPGGAFFWTGDNILRAGWVMLRRDVSDLLAAQAPQGAQA